MEPITTSIAVFLSKIVLDKFYEGVGSRLGEKVVEKAIAPIEKLGQLLWDRCFKGNPETKQLLEKVELKDSQAIEMLKSYLGKALENPQLKAEVEPIVQQIHQTIVQVDDDSTMTQINRDSSKGWQTKVQGGTAYIGEIHIHQ